MRFILCVLVSMLTACTYNNEFQKEDNEMVDLLNNKQGWSASNKLIQANTTQEVSLQANFPEAAPYVAQFKLSNNLHGASAQAEITWSVEGNFIRRLVSICDGTSVQGVGQAVRVVIKDITLPSIPGSGSEYVATVTVVPGTRGSTSNPPTLNLGNMHSVLTNTSLIVPVPQNAGVISVGVPVGIFTANPIPTDSIQVEQLDASGNVLQQYDARQYFWMPLAPGCVNIEIHNYSLFTVELKTVFGIDG